MAVRLLWLVVALICALGVAGQENVQLRIPLSLVECYQDRMLFERDLRLPMTMNMLIELVRKVEDTPGSQSDLRQLAIQMVHRFRQDGIERATGVFTSAAVLPFSPVGFQFSKHSVLLSRLVPGNAVGFPNATLTAQERCALHFMMSASIETAVRGDEATRCNQLAQYRTARAPRSVPSRSNFLRNAEQAASEADEMMTHQRSGRYQARRGYQADNDADEAHDDDETAEPRNDDGADVAEDLDNGLIDVASNAVSQCPVENGVVWTRWGAVSAGTVITAIAAGLQPQMVTTRELLALSRNAGQYRARQEGGPLRVDNRWAATLAGDLAEVALLQGPVVRDINVGGAGAWNNTALPRWFFLSQRERLEMTDAEIRAGIDGLVLANGVLDWRSRASGLRLSQILDMYYSQRGVLGQATRACNRRALFTEVAPIATIQAQTTAFSAVLDQGMQLRVTLEPNARAQFSNTAAEALSQYIPQSLNDLSCEASQAIPNDNVIRRAAAEILIYVDTTWPFRGIEPVIAHLLENIDTNRFGSRYAILGANDARTMVNWTSSLADLYTQWNSTVYQQHPAGLNLRNVVRSIREQSGRLMEFERSSNAVGGRSMIALVLPQIGGVNEADANMVADDLRIVREEVPDLRLLFLTGGPANRFERFVREPRRDIFPLRATDSPAGDNVAAQVNPVIIRIQEVPNRIINPRCGANWEQSSEPGNNAMNAYVEPGGIVFFRVHPNYFFHSTDQRRVRIQGHDYGTITVCTSRRMELPRQNATQNADDLNCRQLNGESFEIDLANVCGDWNYINECPPVFISVESRTAGTVPQNLRCTDNECRFPDNSRFGIHAENFGCFSGADRILVAVPLLIPSVLLLLVASLMRSSRQDVL